MLWGTSKTHNAEERELGKSEIHRVFKKSVLLPPSLLCLHESQIVPAQSSKKCSCSTQEVLKNRSHMTY